MATFHRCMDCAFANWNRTNAGRLHPNGGGRCTWTKKIALPASMADYEQKAVRRELERPRHIDRGEPVTQCDTFVRAEVKVEA